MKAVQINRYGSYEVIEINREAERPAISEEQVLVEVKAAGLNPFDKTVMSGGMQKFRPLPFPITLGGDFSGVIVKTGKSISDFKIGDEIYGSGSIFSGGSGSLAEFSTVRNGNFAKKPKNADFIASAALPLVGSSAVQALLEHLHLQRGQKILIQGGAGGIGHIAVQLAKYLGAFVAVTVNSKDIDFVKKLGADLVIDYKNESFAARVKNFAAVFDTVGGEITNRSLSVLRMGGTLVTMIGQPDLKLAEKYGVTAIRQASKVNSNHLNRLAELVESGRIRVNVDKVFPLDQAGQAFKYREESHPRGKVVIKVNS